MVKIRILNGVIKNSKRYQNKFAILKGNVDRQQFPYRLFRARMTKWTQQKGTQIGKKRMYREIRKKWYKSPYLRQKYHKMAEKMWSEVQKEQERKAEKRREAQEKSEKTNQAAVPEEADESDESSPSISSETERSEYSSSDDDD